MDYKDWNFLRREMAVQSFIYEAADMMIPNNEAAATARKRCAESDAATGGDQSAERIQEWRRLEHQMGNALIALERLGYEVRKK